MEYTLFVDESGTFGHSDRDESWVVGGLLVPGDRRSAEKKIGNALNPIPGRYDLQMGDMHCTKLRKDGAWSHEQIGTLAMEIFRAVYNEEPDAQLLAVRNTSGRGVSDPEQTYRLTLLDLVSLADTTLPANLNIERLSLCVATRTQKSEGRMSSDEDLSKRLQEAASSVEVDLASQGLPGLLDTEAVHTAKQKGHRLLTVADFWCNLVYNMDHEESGDIVEAVEQKSMGQVHRAWSDQPNVRRALVAERDGNDGLALYRWGVASVNGDEQVRAGLQRLCRRLLQQRRDPSFTFEQALEALWSQHGNRSQYNTFMHASERVIGAVEKVHEPKHDPKPLLFRLQNMMIITANRDGQTETAERLSNEQKAIEGEIAQSPEWLEQTFKSQVARIHTMHHQFEFENALNEAIRHREQVEMYGDLLELISDGDVESTDSFLSSAMNLRADMTWFESTAYVCGLPQGASAPVEDALDRAATLFELDLKPEDQSRLYNHSILLRLRQADYSGALGYALEALDVFHDASNGIDPYTLQYSMRAAATCAAAALSRHLGDIKSIYDTVEEHVDDVDKTYPKAFILRDLALVGMMLTSNTRTHRARLQEGRGHLPWNVNSPGNPIRTWVGWTFKVIGRYIAKEEAFTIEVPDEFHHLFLETTNLEGVQGLAKIYHVSPY